MRTLLFTLLFVISGVIYSQNIQYKLMCEQDTIALGDEIRLSLVVVGINNSMIYKKDSRIVDSESSIYSLLYVIPDKLGKQKFGPYQLTINNKKLISNTISVYVVKPEKNINKIKVIIPDTVKINTNEELILKSYDKEINLVLKPNEYFNTINASTLSSTNINKGKARYEYSKTFNLHFVKTGTIVVSNDLFEDMPAEYMIREKKITIIK